MGTFGKKRVSASLHYAGEMLFFTLVCVSALWILSAGILRLGYHWQWYRVPRYLWTVEDGHWLAGPLLQGLQVTVEIAVISLFAASGIALCTALARLSPWTALRGLAGIYLEFVRNTPLLIQILVMYFVVAPVLSVNAFVSAIVALSLFEGAYASEIIRAGIVSIDRGQWQAAQSLGLGLAQTYRHVILPQALRRVLPPLTGQAVSLIKDSALVSVIALYDLTLQAQALVSETFLTFEIWLVVAAIYLAMTLTVSTLARRLEKRIPVKG